MKRKFKPKTNKKRKWKRRLDPGYADACREARKRDNHTCQMPGCKTKRNLQCHHIMPYAKYPSLRTTVSNLICLCRKHHKQVTGKESFYIMLFGNIIRSKTK